MTLRAFALFLAALAATTALAGCVTPASDDALDASSLDVPAGLALVLGPDGAPVAFAAVSFLDEAGEPVALRSTDSEGLVGAASPAGAVAAAVAAPGLGEWRGDAPLPTVIRLPVAVGGGEGAAAASALAFREPLRLGGAFLAGQEDSCGFYNCGASEPVLEVANDGTIYVSGTCCIGESPPIWVSRDGGATFQELEGDALRENYGIEGDFAIDDAGNLYFTDISVASAYIASWTKDGDHRWTVPAGPFAPIVDRPWVRAGEADRAWFLYNAGTTTYLYETRDGGLTWAPLHAFGCGLGNIANGPENDHLWVTACGRLYESTDGGATWTEGEAIPTPTEDGDRWGFWVPVVDEAGNAWVVYDWRASGEDAYHVYAVRRGADGAWSAPHRVSPEAGTHHLPWAAAGADGALVVAWYGTLDDAAGPNSVSDSAQWRVFAAATVNGGDAAPDFQVALADPEPVHEGPMNRKLLDFLQVEIAPDGAVHVAYAQDRGDRPDELTQYVRTDALAALAPAAYPNGPHA